MTHPRKLVRDAVVARLTGATSAGARVEATRIDDYLTTEIPAIAVYTLREPVGLDSAETAPRELTRDLKVEIAGTVAHSDQVNVGDAMDALAEQIEAAMDADRYLGGAAGDSVLEDTEMQIGDPKASPVIGLVTLTYSVTYRTSPAVGELDDFLTAEATTQIVGAGSDNAVSDLFTVQEAPP